MRHRPKHSVELILGLPVSAIGGVKTGVGMRWVGPGVLKPELRLVAMPEDIPVFDKAGNTDRLAAGPDMVGFLRTEGSKPQGFAQGGVGGERRGRSHGDLRKVELFICPAFDQIDPGPAGDTSRGRLPTVPKGYPCPGLAQFAGKDFASVRHHIGTKLTLRTPPQQLKLSHVYNNNSKYDNDKDAGRIGG